MTKFVVNGTEYKVKYGYNCFCDTNLMENVQELSKLFSGSDVKSDADVSGMGKVKDLFCVVRDLLYVGFKKYNPVNSVQDVGDILDDYLDEETDEERGLLPLFVMLSEELTNEGFLSGLLKEMGNQMTEVQKIQKKQNRTKNS